MGKLPQTKCHAAIEVASGCHQVQVRLAVVTLASLVDIRPSQEQEIDSVFAPLHLDLVGFVESFGTRAT